MTSPTTEVHDDPDRHRYVATVGGAEAGFAAYRSDGATVTFTHTEVDDAYEGQGVGSTLVRAALDDVRERGLRVRPLCPFVAAWLQRHPDYQDLVRPPAG
ncbi:GNAT family N-acetyltransferase [Angustibacter peucedani]